MGLVLARRDGQCVQLADQVGAIALVGLAQVVERMAVLDQADRRNGS